MGIPNSVAVVVQNFFSSAFDILKICKQLCGVLLYSFFASVHLIIQILLDNLYSQESRTIIQFTIFVQTTNLLRE